MSELFQIVLWEKLIGILNKIGENPVFPFNYKLVNYIKLNIIEIQEYYFLVYKILIDRKKYCEGKVKRIKKNNLKDFETYCQISWCLSCNVPFV